MLELLCKEKASLKSLNEAKVRLSNGTSQIHNTTPEKKDGAEKESTHPFMGVRFICEMPRHERPSKEKRSQYYIQCCKAVFHDEFLQVKG